MFNVRLVNWFRLITSLLIFSTFNFNSPSFAVDDANTSCSDFEEVRTGILARIQTLKALRDSLNQLETGGSNEMPTSVLFTVSLDDEDAVKMRAEELRKFTKMDASEVDEAIEKHPKASCFSQKDQTGGLKEQMLLELEVARLRLKFLNLSENRRKLLLDARAQSSRSGEIIQELQTEQNKADERIQAAELATKSAEEDAQKAETANLRAIAGEKVIIESVRKDIAQLGKQNSAQLSELIADLKTQSELLTQESAALIQQVPSLNELENSYQRVTQRWRSVTDVLLKQKSNSDQHDIPEVPVVPSELLATLKGQQQAADYSAARDLAVKERQDLLLMRERLIKEQRNRRYGLLLAAGRIRAQLISEISEYDDNHVFSIDNDYLEDLVRELRLIPYRPIALLQSSIFEGKNLVSSGVAGFLNLLKRISLLLLFLVTPFISYSLLRRLSARVDRFRSELIKSKLYNSKAVRRALWIQRINPYLPWIMMLVGTRLAAVIVSGTEVESITAILPYFELFFIYRIFLLILEDTAENLTSYLSQKSIRADTATRIAKSARYIGRFFLGAAYLLQATQSVTRTGLVYHLVWSQLILLTPILLAIVCYSWRDDIIGLSQSLFSDNVNKRTTKWLSSKVTAFFVSLPITIAILVYIVGKRFVLVASRFDAAKRISAKVFRRQIESAAKNVEKPQTVATLDETYLSYFQLGTVSDLSLFVERDMKYVAGITSTISDWLSGKNESHSLAIQGVKGIGKSSLLRKIQSSIKDANIVNLSIKEKICKPQHLFEVLGESLGADLSGGRESLLKWDASAAKTVFTIDEGQNLFLSKRGGFEAFRVFVELMNSGTKNIFWCVTFNRYSWSYLNAVTGGAEYFRSVLRIDNWSDSDIQSMILSRHEKSGYKLEFDPVIFATDSHERDGIKHIQDRFFQMLWEQSRGNPRTAIVLWLSAIRPIDSKRLRVGLPTSIQSRPLVGLTDDELFVIASVIRHENLTSEQAQATTSLTRSTVWHALRVGLERGFLDLSSTGCYRVRPLYQAALTQQLVGKNFVYE